MRIIGRVVGEPNEDSWTPPDSKEPITLRSITVMDTGIKQALECTSNAEDWPDLARLHDNEPVELEVARVPRADRYGRVKYAVRLVK